MSSNFVKIPPSFEKKSESAEVINSDSFYDENFVFSSTEIYDGVSKILMRDGRVFIEYEIIEDHAKDKNPEELYSWDFYKKLVRRKDLDPSEDFVKIINRLYESGDSDEDFTEEYKILECFMHKPI